MLKTDRCDRCGAQAYVEVRFASGPLLFCAHHFAEHEEAIVLSGGDIVTDERHLINVKPSVSASV